MKEYHIVVTNITENPHLDHVYPMLLIFDNKYNLFEQNPNDIIKEVPMAMNKLPGAAGLKKDKQYLFEVPVTKLELHVDDSIAPSAVPIFSEVNYT